MLIRPMMFRGAADAGPTITTWSPTDRSGGLVLADANRTASASSSPAAARGTSSRTASGDYFFEVTIGGTNQGRIVVGIAASTKSLTSVPSISPDTSAVYFDRSSGVSFNGSVLSSTSFASGAVIGIRYLPGNPLVQFYINGNFVVNASLSGDLSSAGSGFPFIGFDAGSANTGKINCGQETFAFPKGIPAWG